MTQSLIISYRVLAGLIVVTPLMVNFTIQGGVVASLVYAPALTLAALILSIYFDGKVTALLSHTERHLKSKTQRLHFVHVSILSRLKAKHCCFKH